MPGRQNAKFRKGNLSEHLGVLLLKGIAAVADVSRPEDVGLDAVATLLRLGEDDNLYAEDSFFVQIKSSGKKSLTYRDHELSWLIEQPLPMFIGRVSLAESCIALHSTLFVNQAVFSLYSKRAELRFGDSGLPSLLAGSACSQWRGNNDDVTVWLGPPILEWSIRDLVDPDWRAQTYAVLKRFLAIARTELELLKTGQFSSVRWKTNKHDSISIGPVMMKGHPDEFNSIAENTIPLIRAMIFRVISANDESITQVQDAPSC